jgi:hypothetical protein
MKTPVLLLLATVLSLALGCRRTDVREMTVSIPSLTPANRATVEQALAKYAGVEKTSYAWDFEKKTLCLRYDSMQIAQTNIRMAIADKGLAVDFPTNTTGRAGY